MSGSGLISCGVFSFTVPESQTLLPNPQRKSQDPSNEGSGGCQWGKAQSRGHNVALQQRSDSGVAWGLPLTSLNPPWYQLVFTQHNNSQFTSSSRQEPHSKSSSSNSSPVEFWSSLISALKRDAVETFLYSTAGEAQSPLQNTSPAS